MIRSVGLSVAAAHRWVEPRHDLCCTATLASTSEVQLTQVYVLPLIDDRAVDRMRGKIVLDDQISASLLVVPKLSVRMLVLPSGLSARSRTAAGDHAEHVTCRLMKAVSVPSPAITSCITMPPMNEVGGTVRYAASRCCHTRCHRQWHSVPA